MNLNDTISLMNSVDYKNRFKAEYFQTKIRYKKLLNMMKKWQKGELDFVPDCPYNLYEKQLYAMVEYLDVLETRAEIEGICLNT